MNTECNRMKHLGSTVNADGSAGAHYYLLPEAFGGSPEKHRLNVVMHGINIVDECLRFCMPYESCGCLNSCCGGVIKHQAVAVGYDSHSGSWIIVQRWSLDI